MFKVVPDQLRLAGGWVRCGKCGEVFEASAHMQSSAMPPSAAKEPSFAEPPSPKASEVLPPPSKSVAPADAPPGDALPLSGPARGGDVPFPSASVDESAAQDAVFDPPVAPARARQEDLYGARWQAKAPLEHDDADAYAMAPLVTEVPSEFFPASTFDSPAAPESPPSEIFAPPSALEDVSFMRQARRKAFWRLPVVRAVLLLIALALLLLLALQGVIQQRDRLSALEPRLKPWLLMLCEPLQCRVGPLRQIESVVIDGSSFNKVNADVFHLGVTLRNSARIEVATPALELTLTDPQDQPVLRRVLQPADLGAPAVLAGSGEWSGAANMVVQAEGLAARVAGYRVLAFYP